MSYQC